MRYHILLLTFLSIFVAGCNGYGDNTSDPAESQGTPSQTDTTTEPAPSDPGPSDDLVDEPVAGDPLPSVDSINIASWNIKHLGADGQESDWQAIAEVASLFDFIGLQEPNSRLAIRQLEEELEAMTGEEWSSLASGTGYGSGYFREYYGFVWKEDVIDYDGGAVNYIDDDRVFVRPPFAARFKTDDGQLSWVASTVHIIWGGSDGEPRRVSEVQELDDYVEWLEAEIGNGLPVVLMGDFNLIPTHEGFEQLDAIMDASITDGATTLSPVDGRFANLYDNLWMRPGALAVNDADIDEFPARIGVTHEYAREFISDHAPVFIEVPTQ